MQVAIADRVSKFWIGLVILECIQFLFAFLLFILVPLFVRSGTYHDETLEDYKSILTNDAYLEAMIDALGVRILIAISAITTGLAIYKMQPRTLGILKIVQFIILINLITKLVHNLCPVYPGKTNPMIHVATHDFEATLLTISNGKVVKGKKKKILRGEEISVQYHAEEGRPSNGTHEDGQIVELPASRDAIEKYKVTFIRCNGNEPNKDNPAEPETQPKPWSVRQSDAWVAVALSFLMIIVGFVSIIISIVIIKIIKNDEENKENEKHPPNPLIQPIQKDVHSAFSAKEKSVVEPPAPSQRIPPTMKDTENEFLNKNQFPSGSTAGFNDQRY